MLSKIKSTVSYLENIGCELITESTKGIRLRKGKHTIHVTKNGTITLDNRREIFTLKDIKRNKVVDLQ